MQQQVQFQFQIKAVTNDVLVLVRVFSNLDKINTPSKIHYQVLHPPRMKGRTFLCINELTRCTQPQPQLLNENKNIKKSNSSSSTLWRTTSIEFNDLWNRLNQTQNNWIQKQNSSKMKKKKEKTKTNVTIPRMQINIQKEEEEEEEVLGTEIFVFPFVQRTMAAKGNSINDKMEMKKDDNENQKEKEKEEQVGTEINEMDNLLALPMKQWTELKLHQYFQRADRLDKRGRCVNDPDLIDISHAKRYGGGLRYKFLCNFRHPTRPKSVIKQWVKYTDLLPNSLYIKVLDNINFDPKKAKEQFNDPEEEWSDDMEGVEIKDKGNKSTQWYPELSLPNDNDDDDKFDTKTKPAQATAKSKKVQKFKSFSVEQFV